MNSGFRNAFLTGSGAMSADATYLILIFFGLTAFLNNPLMKIVLGFAGSVILIYLGIVSGKVFFRPPDNTVSASPRLFKSSFATGYVLAIASPLTIVWWTGVFGALLASQPAATTLSALFSCFSILLGCFAWVLGLAIALHFGRQFINQKITGLISLIAGIFLIGFGLYFMYRTTTLLIH